MASNISPLKNAFACAVLFLLSASKYACGCYKSIISFGDSLADTGNLLYLESTSSNEKPPSGFLPYGETFFHHPTGRFSDGRLIIDFIAQDMGLPFVPPFHGEGNVSRRNYRKGVNFAVGGSTALEDSFFAKIGVKIPYANVSLAAQLSWFKEFLSTICHKPSKCKKFLQTSLVLMGEIGGNDYNHAFFGGKNEEVALFIPQVVKAIGVTIEELIKLGATTLIVPGNFPIGCSSYYLTYFERYKGKYNRDPNTGCISWLNMFSEYHNSLLQMELERIRQIHAHTTIIYADYDNAAMSIYLSLDKYGFTKGTLTACCGGEGPFNVSLTVHCGASGSTTCEDPSKYVS
ncbi:GDSL esterase/lipase At1g28570-like isoform X1 [Olea europaea var. sylvestris]|uniref:GDSL esterase/lipase At1g28570-like isoform X1 n=1 Tax=Olea europaea var. sylvestris TaxID=158386 RepID=UPI000C1D6EBC|nr:GDSL esterase/lipase At1g28570-like isoform X1 [Olea europaea var. sylvestris]